MRLHLASGGILAKLLQDERLAQCSSRAGMRFEPAVQEAEVRHVGRLQHRCSAVSSSPATCSLQAKCQCTIVRRAQAMC